MRELLWCTLSLVLATVSVFCTKTRFDVTAANITVIAGGIAILPCSVWGLGTHKVVWMNPRSSPIFLEARRIINDNRFTLDQPYPREWNLHIQNVQLSDRGTYICTINTAPPQHKTIRLIVHEPAKIIGRWSTKSPVRVVEGDSVSLVCNATGVPFPEVKWYRITGLSQESQRIGKAGEILSIRNATRDCDAKYKCIAYNGVNPADSKVIEVFVEFPPSVIVYISRIRQHRNGEIVLDCLCQAYPMTHTFWVFKDKTIANDYKYLVEVIPTDKRQTKLMLTIRDMEDEDFGEYTCVASNPHGKDEKTIEVYESTRAEYKAPTTSTPISTISTYTTKRRTTETIRTYVVNKQLPRPTLQGYESEKSHGSKSVNLVKNTADKSGQSSQPISGNPQAWSRSPSIASPTILFCVFLTIVTLISITHRT